VEKSAMFHAGRPQCPLCRTVRRAKLFPELRRTSQHSRYREDADLAIEKQSHRALLTRDRDRSKQLTFLAKRRGGETNGHLAQLRSFL
jgi:hypothetical protein